MLKKQKYRVYETREDELLKAMSQHMGIKESEEEKSESELNVLYKTFYSWRGKNWRMVSKP